ncbi:MAG: YmdB family metallophosphoesterase [Oscillospiraceae bacterium]|jgi:metallophosphoesterase (TIGR00282 family)|nr:YmdB family metallophosphoesterase [Oscillospiraceae bacterium]
MPKTYNILAVGDVCGKPGLDIIRSKLPGLKRHYDISFCVVNGENADMRGLTPDQADMLLTFGADVVTLGNHAWSNRSILPYLDDNRFILRPGNFAPQAPGRGWDVFPSPMGNIFVMSLIGRLGMDSMTDSPFFALDRALSSDAAGRCRIRLVDFHAEATSEKLAMRHYAAGRVTCLWGTHTHVQTSDAEVTRDGAGYITDLGMTGAVDGILGVKPETSVDHFLGNPRLRYETAAGAAKLECCIFEVFPDSGKALRAEALRIT